MKDYNKKLGFTLIELLLVIAVLSLLIVGAIPSGLNLYNNARKKSLELKVEGIVDAVKVGYNFATMDMIVADTTYEFIDGDVTQTGNINVEYSGGKIENGAVLIKSTGETAIAIHDGKYCAIKIFGSNLISVAEMLVGECIEAISETTPSTCFTFNSGEITNYTVNEPDCPSDVVIPSRINNVSVTSIGIWAFHNKSLTSVFIPSSVTTIKNHAFESNSLSNVTIPNNVTSIGDSAFQSNVLTSIIIPDSVVSISNYAFSHNQIESIDLGNSLTTIGNNAFYNNLVEEITIPDSVKTIGSYVFGFNHLTNITFGIGINSIGAYALSNNLLTNITIPAESVTIGDNLLNNTNNYFRDAYIVNGLGTYIGTQSGTWTKQ